jgi:hypothetical protein
VAAENRHSGEMILSLTGRLILDLLTALCILFSLAYRITGDAAHEWIGFSASGLLVFHNCIHWSWYQKIFKGRYGFKRALNTAINMILLATAVALLTSGLLQSRTIFSFMHLSGGMLLRRVHTFVAYWGLLLVSIHIGIHWEIICNVISRTMRNTGIVRFPGIITHCLAALVFLYGLDSFFERDMPAKLFLGYSFDFWDEEKSKILFFAENTAIMIVCIWIAHYLTKFIGYIKARNEKYRANGK